ncbi:hypothetical protein H8B06_12050 [Sphingobacterium sp. DN00404]|uniref:Lipid A biosynthesis lauroyl acyltransferase n=1 Tax=Sphingobacterium micropteri TaxID=2763501 RepID=A0ABR7YQF0_9SPHI|nr:hypothetical protein [Sphingobacterium micropteri]MBD1433563.1 hypothetical protein [Sphingobacterium micropteri]
MNSTSSALSVTPVAKENHIFWNQSVKLASMLYHWKLVDSYESILTIIYIHQTYLRQEPFKHDNIFLPQLEKQLPKVDGPRIWACFHIGPYAIMARALIRRGYGIAILLKDEVFEEQYPTYMQQFKRSFGRKPNASELQFVRSSSSKSLIQLKQLLKKGYHVICYVDGEEGGSGERGWTQVQLYNKPLEVRMGMAILSQLSGVPIRPVVLTTEGEKLMVRSRGDLYVNNREQYSAAMQYCYQMLGELPAEEILQWECIPRLFDKIARDMRHAAEKPIWLPVYAKEKNMLLDIVSGKYVEVSAEQFEKMDALRQEFLKPF